ncbi:unnamed protein product, partial [Pleuronectes platessa]
PTTTRHHPFLFLLSQSRFLVLSHFHLLLAVFSSSVTTDTEHGKSLLGFYGTQQTFGCLPCCSLACPPSLIRSLSTELHVSESIRAESRRGRSFTEQTHVLLSSSDGVCPYTCTSAVSVCN